MTLLTKKRETKSKQNFSLQAWRLAESWGLEQFSSAIDWQVMELQSGGKTVAHMGFLHTTCCYTGSKHVN